MLSEFSSEHNSIGLETQLMLWLLTVSVRSVQKPYIFVQSERCQHIWFPLPPFFSSLSLFFLFSFFFLSFFFFPKNCKGEGEVRGRTVWKIGDNAVLALA